MRNKLIPTVLLLVVLGVFAGVVLATGGTPGGDGDDQVKEDVVKAILDDDGNVIDHNRSLAQVAKDHEGGFGGWYFSDDKDTVYVYMTDVTKTAQARSAFLAAYLGDDIPSNTVVVSGNHSLEVLVKWLYELLDGLLNDDVALKTFSVDHAQNRVSIGVALAGDLERAKGVADGLGIPASAVEFYHSDSQLLGSGDLDEEWRPVDVAMISDPYPCTL